MFKNEEYSSFLKIFTKNKFTVLLFLHVLYRPRCLFAGTDKERLCVSKTSLRSRRYSRAQGGKLEIPPAQKLSILSSPAAG